MHGMNERRLHFQHFVTFSVLVLSLSASFAGGAQEATNVRLPELRDELLVRVDKDQAARKTAIAWVAEHGADGIIDENALTEEEKATHASLWAEVARIDVENTAWLRDVVDGHGWLTYSDVGRDGAGAAWLMVQHADANPSFQRQCLDLMTGLPRDEVSQENVAYLTDRVLIAEGENQIYGTQFVVREGEWVPLNLEDEENVDSRRAEVGLPPLDEYREMIEAMARGDLEID